MGIMHTESIITTLLAAAAFLKHPIQEVAGQAIHDTYETAKAYLRKKLGAGSEAANALEFAAVKPESMLRKAVLAEVWASVDLAGDAELARVIERLAVLLPPRPDSTGQKVEVSGRGHRVHVAGRDLIHTEKLVRRNTITPDERHLTVVQRDRLRKVIDELAERLAGTNGRGGVSAVHAMLQRRFQVSSYLLIPRERYDEALRFLCQQRAIHRSRLRDRDPVAYANDLYRAIFAGARELGWDGEHVYQFATEQLALKRALVSLKELGPIQLKTLAEAVQRAVRAKRQRAAVSNVADPISE